MGPVGHARVVRHLNFQVLGLTVDRAMHGRPGRRRHATAAGVFPGPGVQRERPQSQHVAWGRLFLWGPALAGPGPLKTALRRPYGDVPWQSETTQIELMLRSTGGTFMPRSIIILRMSAAVSGRAMADCTPTRTSPSA